jgi:hypothetical protein
LRNLGEELKALTMVHLGESFSVNSL